MGERRKKRVLSERKTPEGMESQLINLAMQRAAEMLADKTAPAQIITHFLRLGTARAKAEVEKLKADAVLQRSKVELIEYQKQSEALAKKALEAFKRYSGREDDEDDEDYDDDY